MIFKKRFDFWVIRHHMVSDVKYIFDPCVSWCFISI